jgi:hypothetical protein
VDVRPRFVFLMTLAVFLVVLSAGLTSANFALDLVVSPQTAVPNQRVTLDGRGYTPSSQPGGNGPAGSHQITGIGESVISVGGAPLVLPNAFYPINFDESGDWTAFVSIPVTDVTVAGGSITIEAVDDQGVSHTVQVIIGIPSITVSPESSRINTEITVTGQGFPASNLLTRLNSQVPIFYAGFPLTVISADDLGRFTAKIQVPSTTKIPSNNIVKATVLGLGQLAQAVHAVPEPAITVSPPSGVPGTAVAVTGQGFPPNILVSYTRAGNINVSRSPAPTTDDNGAFLSYFSMPVFSPGFQTVSVTAEGLVGASFFEVLVGTPVNQPLPTPPSTSVSEDALAALTQSNDLMRVWTFDNATKRWEFFDPRPAFLRANTIKTMVPGRIYWLHLIRDRTVSLNGKVVGLFEGWNLHPW